MLTWVLDTFLRAMSRSEPKCVSIFCCTYCPAKCTSKYKCHYC